MKTIKMSVITHKLYAHDAANSEFHDKAAAMFEAAISLINTLRAKYAKYSFAPLINYTEHSDSDDDAFTYIYLTVPAVDGGEAQRCLRNATKPGYSRGWYVSIDAEVRETVEHEYKELSKRLRPGQLAYYANRDVDHINIRGVDGYSYDFGVTKDLFGREVVTARKSCIINNSGVSTKMLSALSRYSFDASKVKSKLPKDAKKNNFCNYITVDLSEKNRANIMKLARTSPSVLRFYNGKFLLAIRDADKSDFVKTYYAEKDKEAKTKAAAEASK